MNRNDRIPGPALAHVSEDGRKHLLLDHLKGTAERAAAFAGEFGREKILVRSTNDVLCTLRQET